MAKSIIVAGYGPGISQAVATRFGAEGFRVALVARNGERIARAAADLTAAGTPAQGFAADLSKPGEVTAVVNTIRAAHGATTVLHWNAYGGGAGDLTTAPLAELDAALGIAVTSLVAAVQAALPDLRAQKGAVLATNGGFGILDPKLDAIGVKANSMGLSVANAAKRKLIGVLSAKLAPEVYVGEVVVTGTVKGSAWDTGAGNTIEPARIAQRFWDLYTARTDVSVMI